MKVEKEFLRWGWRRGPTCIIFITQSVRNLYEEKKRYHISQLVKSWKNSQVENFSYKKKQKLQMHFQISTFTFLFDVSMYVLTYIKVKL